MTACVGEDAEKGEHSSTADGSENLYSHSGSQYGSLSENWESTYLNLPELANNLLYTC